MMETMEVDFMDDGKNECKQIIEGHASFLLLKYHNVRVPAAWIPTSMSWDQLWANLSAQTRKEVRRTGRKGYYCELFNPKRYCQDIFEINHSKLARQGKSMNSWYLHSVEGLLKEEFQNYKAVFSEECFLHCKVWFGVFTKEKKLVGYIALTRVGQFSTYESILGHGDYLKDDIMLFLHFFLQKYIRESKNLRFKGIIGTAYWTYDDGKEGVTFWKRTAGFCPCLLFQSGTMNKPNWGNEYKPDEWQAHPHP
jgi:hypothetical protein